MPSIDGNLPILVSYKLMLLTMVDVFEAVLRICSDFVLLKKRVTLSALENLLESRAKAAFVL